MDESDAELVARVRAGDKAAFGGLIERHRPMAWRLASRLLGSRADAEDVVQEACLQAVLGLDNLITPERFGSWLGGIALNLARMRVRARREGYSLDDWVGGRLAVGFTWAETQPTPEAVYEARELHNMVLSAVAELPLAQQDAVRQHYWEGLSMADIGRLADVPASTVRARLSRARHRLRAGLTRELIRRPVKPITNEEEPTMIEVFVHDIVSRLPPQPTPASLAGRPSAIVLPAVVLLKPRNRERVLAITIGPCERDAITVLLVQMPTPRPLMFEFFARVLEATGATVERVAVTRLHDNVFYATTWLRSADGQTHEIDTRPSDAIILALRVKAPIFVDEAVLDEAGVEAANTDDYLDERRRTDQVEGKAENEQADLEWASLVDILRKV
jgi:RNA polymerase sigma factor (sigma-70 family)